MFALHPVEQLIEMASQRCREVPDWLSLFAKVWESIQIFFYLTTLGHWPRRILTYFQAMLIYIIMNVSENEAICFYSRQYSNVWCYCTLLFTVILLVQWIMKQVYTVLNHGDENLIYEANSPHLTIKIGVYFWCARFLKYYTLDVLPSFNTSTTAHFVGMSTTIQFAFFRSIANSFSKWATSFLRLHAFFNTLVREFEDLFNWKLQSIAGMHSDIKGEHTDVFHARLAQFFIVKLVGYWDL